MNAKELFFKCDTDEDGYITYHELLSAINSEDIRNHICPEVMREIQKKAIENGKKKINCKEFERIMEGNNVAIYGNYVEKAAISYVKFLVPKRKEPQDSYKPFS